MKIEIDINEILNADSEDGLTMEEAIRRHVVKTVSNRIDEKVFSELTKRVDAALSKALADAVAEQIPKMMNEIIDSEYTPIDRYGGRGSPTTFRRQMISTFQEQMTYKKSDYNGNKSAFTVCVDEVVSSQLAEFKRSFQSLVTADFTKAAFEHATEKLREILKLK